MIYEGGTSYLVLALVFASDGLEKQGAVVHMLAGVRTKEALLVGVCFLPVPLPAPPIVAGGI